MQPREKGFTLIELLIAITLGLILVAVAVQLVISGQINYKIQQAASSVQDTGVFSLNAVTKNIRLANHGNAGAMNDETLYGGIVLDENNLQGLNITAADYVSEENSQDAGFNAGFGSDQLVIMYQAPVDMVTCTGENIDGPVTSIDEEGFNSERGEYVIEKYYLKGRGAGKSGADLYCKSVTFFHRELVSTPEGGTPDLISVTVNNEQMIAPNVDFMRVMLKVRNSDQSTATMSLDAYKDIVETKPAIIGIDLAWLAKSNEIVQNNKIYNFQVLDKDLEAPQDKYMRHVYSTTVALRNGGLGDIIE